MRPFPYTHTGAGIVFYTLMVIFAASELRVRLRSVLNRQGTRSDRGSFALVYVTVAAGVGGAFILAVHARAAAIGLARGPVFVLGALLMAAGIVIRQWAVALLGGFFTTDVRVHEQQTVVDTGPYRWVRHPSYTGLVMIFLGLGLALGNWAALALLAIAPTAGLVVRIRVEERALLDGLGEPYRRFAAGRDRLIPHVW